MGKKQTMDQPIRRAVLTGSKMNIVHVNSRAKEMLIFLNACPFHNCVGKTMLVILIRGVLLISIFLLA
jgi:hypothetical protein